MFPSKVIRFVPEQNEHLIPENAVVLRPSPYKPGLIKVKLDFHWIRNNTVRYERMMGRK